VDLTLFFQKEGIDVFSEVSIDILSEKDRSFVVQFFPRARFVIVFGKEVPVPVYLMLPKEKTQGMLRIAETLDTTAGKLAASLEAEHVPALPVPLYLPVRLSDGRVQGVVRLKRVAAAGGIGTPGRNTILLSPRFGPRLLLSGVVTGRSAWDSGQAQRNTGRGEDPVCTGCGRCTSVCPVGSLGPKGVDAFRCQTVSAWVPPGLVPAAKWMLGRRTLLKCIAPFAPRMARVATIRCSLCITECPGFYRGSKKRI
jgi:epoxyqueuosine reductase QueG